MSTILAIDVGNTSTTLGIVNGRRITRVARIEKADSKPRSIEKAIRKVVSGVSLQGAIICSVVPSLDNTLRANVKRICSQAPIVVTHRSKMDITIDYGKPKSIGADRLTNACGAVAKYGAPIIIADFGTALTFDVVSAERAYVGGAIAPGLPLMTDYLADRTALLPRIKLQGFHHPIGRSTEEAMLIGAQIGYRGIARELTNHFRCALKSKRVKLCATGGFAKWALRGAGMPFIFDQHLTLFGLGRIFELNSKMK